MTSGGPSDPSSLTFAREILAAACRAGLRDRWRVLAVAICVTTAVALAEVVVEDLVHRANLPVSVVADLSASAVSLLGAVFLSGFLCKLVRRPDDESAVTLREVAKTLPWGRLIGADLLVSLLVVVGLIALVIPGLIALNLLAVAGPVIETEDRAVIAALRRSAQLVRPRFWMVALLVTVPVIAATEIDTLGPEPAGVVAALEFLAIRGVAAGIVEAAIGLVLVKLNARLAELSASQRTP